MIYKTTVFFLFIVCLLGFSGNAVAQKQTEQTDEVLQTLKKYDAAWNKKDSAAVGTILAPDYIYFNSTGGISTRQQTLDFLESPTYILTFVERSEIQTRRMGNTAVVGSRWKGKGTYDKGEINDDQRCSLVFAKAGKQWLLLSEHCTDRDKIMLAIYRRFRTSCSTISRWFRVHLV